MTSLTYSELELLVCLHFPMAATGIKQGGHVTLMWLAALWSGLAMLWSGCAVLASSGLLLLPWVVQRWHMRSRKWSRRQPGNKATHFLCGKYGKISPWMLWLALPCIFFRNSHIRVCWKHDSFFFSLFPLHWGKNTIKREGELESATSFHFWGTVFQWKVCKAVDRTECIGPSVQ